MGNLINKSDANWSLAQTLIDESKYNEGANRLYYALFQAVKAYAVKNGEVEIGTKERIHERLHELVKREDRESRGERKFRYGEVFGMAMARRAKGDYQEEDVAAIELDREFRLKVQDVRDYYKKRAV